MTLPALAIDIGGTKIAAGLVDPDGTGRGAVRAATPAADAPALWTALVSLARSVATEPVCGVGVGCGGPMEWPAGIVSPLNIPAWRGFPLRARLAAEFPGVPVRVHNDASCFAVAAHWSFGSIGSSGSIRSSGPVGNLLGMVVSTGVGGGLVLGGHLFDGGTGNAGHVGHIVVDPSGPPCTCGGRGCVEAIARGAAVLSWARERGWVGSSTADLVADGDPVGAFARAGRAVGIAVASAVHLLDLDAVVIGGGLANAGALLFDAMHAAYAEHARLPYAGRVSIEASALAHPGLVGAAALIHAGERYWNADGPVGAVDPTR